MLLGMLELSIGKGGLWTPQVLQWHASSKYTSSVPDVLGLDKLEVEPALHVVDWDVEHRDRLEKRARLNCNDLPHLQTAMTPCQQ